MKNNKLVIGAVSGFILLSALVALPLVAANAETGLHTNSSNGTGMQNGTGNGSASSGYQASLEARAKAVGMTSTELTEALKTKTMDQIMTEKNINTADYQAKMAAASKARWESKGLSAEEVGKRVEWQKNRQATENHDGTNQSQGGYGRQNI